MNQKHARLIGRVTTLYDETKHFKRYLKRVANSLPWQGRTEFYASIERLLNKEAT